MEAGINVIRLILRQDADDYYLVIVLDSKKTHDVGKALPSYSIGGLCRNSSAIKSISVVVHTHDEHPKRAGRIELAALAGLHGLLLSSLVNLATMVWVWGSSA